MTEHPAPDWKAKFEHKGPERVKGLSGVDIRVSSAVGGLVEGILQGLAVNHEFDEMAPSEIADAVLKGLSNHGLTKEKIIAYYEGERKK